MEQREIFSKYKKVNGNLDIFKCERVQTTVPGLLTEDEEQDGVSMGDDDEEDATAGGGV